ncbi:hypothetical protein GCM10027299_50790 [Larkinella ripae]
MNELERIDDYFSGRLSSEDRARFEMEMQSDPSLAEAVAFYTMTHRAAQAEARTQRKAELDALRSRSARVQPLPIRSLIALAASVILIVGLGVYWLFHRQAASPTELADQYITEKYSQLSGTLSGQTDSLQTGISLYNRGDFQAAGAVFKRLLVSQPDNDRVLQFAGLAALQTGQYDQAIELFHRLGTRTDLFANPGLFLEALSRLKRGQPTDQIQAETLLKTVVQQNLDGKAEAEKLLKTM